MFFTALLASFSGSVPAQESSTTRVAAVTESVRMTDLDGDGLLDRLQFGPAHRLTIALNRGMRRFEEIRQELPAVVVTDVLVDDLNGDGHPDLYLVSPQSDRAWIGDGTGHFADATAELGLSDGDVGVQAERVDVDADGILDVLLHNRDGDVVFWGNREGTYERDASTRGERTPPGDSTSPPHRIPIPHGTDRGVRGLGEDAEVGTLSLGHGGRNFRFRRPFDFCLPSIRDLTSGGCLSADSTPTFGSLYPLGPEFNIDPAGRVGIGTTTPNAELNVIGAAEISGDLRVLGASVGLRASVAQIDGANSGIDADLLDGRTSVEFSLAGHAHSFTDISGVATDFQISDVHTHAQQSIDANAIVDGEGSGLDSDHLDGMDSTEFATSSHSHAGLWSVNGNIRYYNSGNVGIGTSTPAERLSVAGIVESSTGGFRFPDGSIQTSADIGGGVPSGFMILNTSQQVASGYTAVGSLLDEWITRAPMPTARTNLATAVVNGRIYAIGGNSTGPGSTVVEEYDPVANAWTTKAPMPTSRASMAAAVVNGKIYVIGGIAAGPIVAIVEEYDPATNSWRARASMPTARANLTAAVVNGRIYAIAGRTPTYVSTLEEYDPSTNTWTSRPPMPLPGRAHLASAVANNLIYVVGGFDGTALNTLVVYNPAINQWAARASMPTARGYLAAETVNGKILAVGGFNSAMGPPYLRTVEEYDPTTNTWAPRAPLSTAAQGPGSANVNERLFAIGGQSPVPQAAVQEYDPGPGLYLYRRN